MNMKKSFIIISTVLLSCILFLSPEKGWATDRTVNICEEKDSIRVFIGTTENLSNYQKQEYENNRQNLIKQRSAYQPNDLGNALITFDDFLSEKEVESIVQDVNTIQTVYIWIPNKEGRAIIDVKNNDIITTLENFFKSLDIENATNLEYKSDMEQLISGYGIFAVEVQAKYSILDDINSHNSINVDLIQSQEAMILAEESNKPITYICVPEKPDGTA